MKKKDAFIDKCKAKKALMEEEKEDFVIGKIIKLRSAEKWIKNCPKTIKLDEGDVRSLRDLHVAIGGMDAEELSKETIEDVVSFIDDMIVRVGLKEEKILKCAIGHDEDDETEAAYVCTNCDQTWCEYHFTIENRFGCICSHGSSSSSEGGNSSESESESD